MSTCGGGYFAIKSDLNFSKAAVRETRQMPQITAGFI
jgi:hypothetical protein